MTPRCARKSVARWREKRRSSLVPKFRLPCSRSCRRSGISATLRMPAVPGKQQLMIAAHVRPEPRAMERIELRRQPDEAVREHHVREILDPQVIGDQQVTNLVLRVQQQQRDRFQRVRFLEAAADRVERLRQVLRLEQLELTLLAALEQALVVGGLVDERRNARAQLADFAFEVARRHQASSGRARPARYSRPRCIISANWRASPAVTDCHMSSTAPRNACSDSRPYWLRCWISK